MMLQKLIFETLNEVKSDREIVETSNQNKQMQDIESFKTNPNLLKLDHRMLR